jgi:Rieske 2Fe-2S family protein
MACVHFTFRNGRIICPYHTWTYSLDGELLATPHRLDTGSFDRANYSLYSVNLDTWRGFVFVNLAETGFATGRSRI